MSERRIEFTVSLNENQIKDRIRRSNYWNKPFTKDIVLLGKVPQEKKPFNFDLFDGVYFKYSDYYTSGEKYNSVQMFFPEQSAGSQSIEDTIY